MKRLTLLMLTTAIISGCASLTSETRHTSTGDPVVIAQFPPEPDSECTMVHNEIFEQNLLERYTDAGMVVSFYADSDNAMKLAEDNNANYVHIYIPPKKQLFGIIDLNYNDKPRATYYSCKNIPGQKK